jgi:hypothetical protein
MTNTMRAFGHSTLPTLVVRYASASFARAFLDAEDVAVFGAADAAPAPGPAVKPDAPLSTLTRRDSTPPTLRLASDDRRGLAPYSPIIPPGWSPSPHPVTAAAVYDRLAEAGVRPELDGEALTLPADTPPDLIRLSAVLHTDIRAVVSGRRWVGCESGTGRTSALDPAKPIPIGVTLLCVEGDAGGWDRLPPTAVSDAPDLFGPARPRSAGRGGEDWRAKRRAAAYRNN